MQILNIASYKFIHLLADKLPELAGKFKDKCIELQIKGTVLLSEEGINLSLSGALNNITFLKNWLTEDNQFTDLEFKESYSNYQPFNRMLVKIKAEIIPFGFDDIQPADFTAPYLSPRDLKKWLDDDRDMTLLDVRNTYETRLGSFKQARKLPIDVFRAFSMAIREIDNLDNSKPLVTFCTGGIRCEKASLFLLRKGFKEVYQLEGGILKYFEKCGDAHYQGECFVYDSRVSLDSSLMETTTVQCFKCAQPLTIEEQNLPSYTPAVSCPYCIDGKPVKSRTISKVAKP